MNTGTEDGGGVTRVGDRGFFMVGSHVGHDCQVGNDVTFANNAVLGGHVDVGDHVFLGGHVGGAPVRAHRRGRHDRRAVGGARRHHSVRLCALARSRALGRPQYRRDAAARRSRAEMHRLRRAYRALFVGEGEFADRIDAVEREFADDPLVGKDRSRSSARAASGR